MSWNFRHILTQPKVKTVLLVSVLISLTVGAAWFGSVSWIKTFFGSVCSRFCGHLESHLDMWSSWILCFSCQIAVQCALAGRHECQKYCCHVPIYTPYQWDERIPIGRILWIMAMLTEKHSSVYKDRPTFYPWNGFEVSCCYFSTSNLQETSGISIFFNSQILDVQGDSFGSSSLQGYEEAVTCHSGKWYASRATF